MKRVSEKPVYRLLLVGKTGSGKSATGNWILGRPDFNSIKSANSVARDICVSERTVLHESKIRVVDTPGLFDGTESVLQRANKIQDSTKFLSPGPHAFLIVLKAGRVTEEDERTLEILKIMFGPKFVNHAIIILTHIDQVRNVKQFLQESEENKGIKSMFDMCRRRIITINNKENDVAVIQRERDKLMLMVDELTDNGMQYYQDDPSVYKDSLLKHAEEWTDTHWGKWEIQKILQEYQEEMNREEIKRPKEMAVRHERENLTIKLTEEELKTAREEAQWKTVASKFLHTAVASFLELPVAVMEAAASLFSGSTHPKETKSSDS